MEDGDEGWRRIQAGALWERMEEAGLALEETSRGITVTRPDGRVKPLHVITEPYPGFPTDLQAQLMEAMAVGR